MYGMCMYVCKHVTQVDTGMCAVHHLYGNVVACYEYVCMVCIVHGVCIVCGGIV